MKIKSAMPEERPPCTCSRCGRRIAHNDNIFEWQESFLVRFRGGYGSVFGDGNVIEGDFCQHCIREVLGPYLRVREDCPFEPTISLDGQARKIDQPNLQETDKPHSASELRSLFFPPKKKIDDNA